MFARGARCASQCPLQSQWRRRWVCARCCRLLADPLETRPPGQTLSAAPSAPAHFLWLLPVPGSSRYQLVVPQDGRSGVKLTPPPGLRCPTTSCAAYPAAGEPRPPSERLRLATGRTLPMSVRFAAAPSRSHRNTFRQRPTACQLASCCPRPNALGGARRAPRTESDRLGHHWSPVCRPRHASHSRRTAAPAEPGPSGRRLAAHLMCVRVGPLPRPMVWLPCPVLGRWLLR
eukprot:3693959-Prymnesium_polylepis.2